MVKTDYSNGAHADLHAYEKRQSFNFITTWLHSFRYRNLVDIFSKLQKQLERPVTVFEIGAATGKLFSVLDQQFDIEYEGVEMRADRVEVAKARYQHCPNFAIACDTAEDYLDKIDDVDVIVALETMEHIPEHIVVRIIEKVAEKKPLIFICSVPVEVGPVIWVKNVGSLLMSYKRFNDYTWPETFWSGLYKLDRVRPHDTTHRGFDWRWLAQTIRHNMRIVETRSLPTFLLPASLSPTVMFVAEPRTSDTGID